MPRKITQKSNKKALPVSTPNHKPERVLFIGAHPDDLELGCWGTMLHHLNHGDEIFAIVFSKGEKGTNGMPEDRFAISEKAYLSYGIKKEHIYLLDIPDTRFPDNCEKIFKFIEKICQDENITKVFTHTNKEYHQDHITVYNETLRAARNVENVLMYESNAHTFPTFSPNYFVDVTDYIDNKVLVINKHVSQCSKKYCESENILALAKLRGYQSRTSRYSEGFEVHRMVQL